jgi:fructoselysine 6-kinase
MTKTNQSEVLKAASFTVAVLDYFCLQDEHFAGGNALNQAVHYSQAGIESALVGAVGNDHPGTRLFSLLHGHGVDTSHLYSVEGETARNSIRNDEAGERFGVEGSWQGGVYEDFKLSEDDWAFLTGFDIWSTHANCPNFEETLRRKSDAQCLAVDFLHLEDFEHLKSSLGKIDIAFVGGEASLKDSLCELAVEMDALIVLTLGAEGSIAFKGDKVFRQEALPVDIVVDTTGCGDAFQAAFCRSYIQSGDVQVALRAGSHAGMVASMRYGGVPWPN